MDPESFVNHQNDSVLHSIFLEGIFLEGLDEELVRLVKRHELDWATMHTNALVTAAAKLSKTLWKGEKEKAKIMTVQLQQFGGPPKLTCPDSSQAWKLQKTCTF